MSTDKMPRFDDIDDVREHYRRNKISGRWFSENNTRHAGSRYYCEVYTTPLDGSIVYFVTSERSGFERNSPRAYSVRAYDVATASVTTVGTFCAHKTLAQAKSAARFVAGVK